jgi:hypothetical protein
MFWQGHNPHFKTLDLLVKAIVTTLFFLYKSLNFNNKMLVVEPDYLPDSEVFCFQPCLYPMKYLHPRSMYTLPCGGVQRGVTPSTGSGGEALEGKITL